MESVTELARKKTSAGATLTGSVSGSYRIYIWDENMRPITEIVE